MFKNVTDRRSMEPRGTIVRSKCINQAIGLDLDMRMLTHPFTDRGLKDALVDRLVCGIDILPCLKTGDSYETVASLSEWFALRRREAGRRGRRLAVTTAPCAVAACPAARIFFAALTSRSWFA